MPKTSPIPPRISYETPPVLLRRERAAAYLDISPVHFDKMVREGKLPPPKRLDNNIRAWLVPDLYRKAVGLPYDGESAPDDSWT
jgi:hypothetical protein